MSKTKTKRRYKCPDCKFVTHAPSLLGKHYREAGHGTGKKSRVKKDPDAKQLDSVLIEAALDAVKAEFKDAHKDRARIAKKIRRQGEALITLAEELEG